MKVLRGFLEIEAELESAAVSIGNFDGVHRGHQAVIASAVADGNARRAPSVVCSFDPHTRIVLRPDRPPRLLETLEQRLDAIAGLGVDLAIVIPFTSEVAVVSADDFVKRFLRERLDVATLHVSEAFTFGKGGRGNVEFLLGFGEELGFEVRVAAPVLVNGSAVSSTRIRDAVCEGQIREANELLGRPFALIGEVVEGEGRGRELDAPTANLAVENGCMPAAGVYVAQARLGSGNYRAVANVGVRPTFGAGGPLTVEAHLLDYGGQLYGERMELGLLKRLRAEQAFEDAETLAAQIRQDVQQALAYFEAV